MRHESHLNRMFSTIRESKNSFQHFDKKIYPWQEDLPLTRRFALDKKICPWQEDLPLTRRFAYFSTNHK